jgi:hypothetical protein
MKHKGEYFVFQYRVMFSPFYLLDSTACSNPIKLEKCKACTWRGSIYSSEHIATDTGVKVNFTLKYKGHRVGVQVELYSFFNRRARWGFPLYSRLCGSHGRWGRVRKISPQPGFDPRTAQFGAIPAQNICVHWVMYLNIVIRLIYMLLNSVGINDELRRLWENESGI